MLTDIALYLKNYCNTAICKMSKLHISNVVSGTYRIINKLINNLLVIVTFSKKQTSTPKKINCIFATRLNDVKLWQ